MNTKLDPRFSRALIGGATNDLSDLIDKIKNAQNNVFFELFKHIINSFPNPDDAACLLDHDRHTFFIKYIIPLTQEINRLKDEYSIKKLDTEWASIVGDNSGLTNPDVYDLMDDSHTERLSNPDIGDIIPDICISERTYLETETNGNVTFPYNEIPMMCIIPSVGIVYDNVNKVSELYNKVPENRKCHPESAILEISVKSLLEDYRKIFAGCDPNTKDLNEDGMRALRNVIEKYSNFAIALIMINLRKDHEYGTNFTDVIYNHFANNYQSAIVANKYMYGITTALIYSKLGHDLVHAYAFKYATSVIDLMDQNNPCTTVLTEQLVGATGQYVIANYMDYIKNLNVDFTGLIESAKSERVAMTALSDRFINMILSVLSESICIDGNIQMNENLGKIISTTLLPLKAMEDDAEYSAAHRALVHIVKGCEHGTILELTKQVAKVQMVRTFTSAPGVRSNRAQFTPIAQEILSGKEMQMYNYIGNNSAALECSDFIKEIVKTKTCNAVMRMVAVECENLNSLEDAKHILMETKMFRDAYNHSSVTEETADTKEFKTFLNNVETQVSDWMKNNKNY